MKKKPNYILATYLIVSATSIACVASVKTPTVTPESIERSFVTQICNGDYKTSPYAGILVFICFVNYGIAAYLIFPDDITNIVKESFYSLEEKSPSGIGLVESKTSLIKATNENQQQTHRTVLQPKFKFVDSQSLIEVLQENLGKDFPQDLFRVIYLSALKQKQSGINRLFVYEAIDYLLDKNIQADARKINDNFRQLEIFNYGRCYEDEHGLSFEFGGIENG